MNEMTAHASALPEGWSRAIGSDVFEFVTSGSRGWAQHYSSTGAKFIRVGNLNHNTIALDLRDTQHVQPPQHAEGKRTQLRPNDIAISITAELGMVALIPNGIGEAYINQHVALARPKAGNDPRYLAWYLASAEDGKRQMIELKRGATKVGLRLDDIRKLQIPLPPLPEQKRIADKLDRLLGRVDACRERLDRIPAILKRFRQSVLAAATSGELTGEWRVLQPLLESAAQAIERTPKPVGKETGRAAGAKSRPGKYALSVGPCNRKLPSGWEWVALSRIAKLESGHTPTRAIASYWNGGIPWLGIPDARENHGGVVQDTIQTVSQEGLDNSSARLLPARTVSLSRTASVGYVTIMGRPMATSQDFANWICSPALLPEYLMCALMAEGDGLKDFGEGSTHTTIYFPELKALYLALPPPSEQAEIVRRTQELLRLARDLEHRLSAGQGSVATLTASILAKAFRGELVPQDPNDEPAAALLARIAEEGQNRAPAKTRGRRRAGAAG